MEPLGNIQAIFLLSARAERGQHATLAEELFDLPPRVQVPNNHILSKILTYITTILKPNT